jgi:hypothetical protein
MTQTVSWTTAKRDALRAAYTKATTEGAPSFKITVKPEGELEFAIGYAKYLLEYLDTQLGPAPRRQPDNEGEESYTTGSGSWEGDGRAEW